jgi:hypothetical protein
VANKNTAVALAGSGRGNKRQLQRAGQNRFADGVITKIAATYSGQANASPL